MIDYILIAWILIHIKAPIWTFVVLAIGVAFKLFAYGVHFGNRNE